MYVVNIRIKRIRVYVNYTIFATFLYVKNYFKINVKKYFDFKQIKIGE